MAETLVIPGTQKIAKPLRMRYFRSIKRLRTMIEQALPDPQKLIFFRQEAVLDHYHTPHGETCQTRLASLLWRRNAEPFFGHEAGRLTLRDAAVYQFSRGGYGSSYCVYIFSPSRGRDYVLEVRDFDSLELNDKHRVYAMPEPLLKTTPGVILYGQPSSPINKAA